MEKKIVLITGGTGNIGEILTNLLISKGYEVRYLSRNGGLKNNIFSYKWDIKNKTIDINSLENVSAIVHLAGAGIADKPWTEAYKQEIISSRIESSGLLKKAITESSNFPKVIVSASAIGIYKQSDLQDIVDEESALGTDFLAEVCKTWESKADEFSELGIRTSKLRIGIVLSQNGGALPAIAKPIRYFAGAPLGSGRQWMPWIHVNDLAAMIVHSIENEHINGVFNAVSPNPVTNKEFTYLLAKKLKRPILLPNVPGFVMKIILGEMADLVLNGNHISSEKIQKTGFKFEFEDLEDALSNLIVN
ncbi:MAG: TIGR01777 family oxidoreductase [Bacteroidota bacterium]|nr:TIGR01777 family oxidoreductase [Bacteroidota bacterium]